MSLRPLFLLGISIALFACATTPGDDTESQEGAWEAESADHEESSTHLWIVNRGIEILASHAGADEVAQRTATLMNDAACRQSWQQGLLDADFKAIYNNGRTDLPVHPNDFQVFLSGATWESHFFDPETRLNYKGAASPTAFTEANAHLQRALDASLAQRRPAACYELGLALHYYTDLTQPMHAANFTAVSRPAKLHSNLEVYAMELQARFPLADWTGAPTGTPSDFVFQTAKDSKPFFMQGIEAVTNAYRSYEGVHVATCRSIDVEPWRFLERQVLDYRHCWEGNAGVDAVIGKTLQNAQDHTAKFLYLVGKQLAAPLSGLSGQNG